MDIWCASASAQIFKHTRKHQQDSPIFLLSSARNMFTSFQICLRNVDTSFDISSVELPCTPTGISCEYYFTDYIVFNDGVPYPDIISTKDSVHVLRNTTQSIFVRFYASADANAGTYKLPISIKTSEGLFSSAVTLTVYPVALPEPKSSHIYHEYFFDPMILCAPSNEIDKKIMPTQYPYEAYSEKFWSLMGDFAKKFRELRVNCLHVPVLRLLCDGGSKRINTAKWDFSYELLDKFIEFFILNGSVKKLSIKALIASVSGETINSIDENGAVIALNVFTPEADAWAKAIYGGIYSHFKEKGWLDMLQMRLEDEPHSSEYWKWAREKCRAFMPRIICGEPLDTHSIARELENECDQYIPRIEVYEEGKDYYLERQKAGDQVWCYSCCYPEATGWMNKFIDLPCLYSRLMAWACFSHGIEGFLHWGSHYWNSKLYGLDQDARFKGDGFIVYPDVENNCLLHSARGFATCDGFQDWELLLMLKKEHPEAASAISHRIAKSFTDLSATALDVDSARTELLTLLS